MVDLPGNERPRERLARLGVGGLSDRELLALVLRTGGRGASALDLAARLLSDQGSLGELARARVEEVAGACSMGAAKASSLIAAFELGRRAGASTDNRRAVASPEDLAALVTSEFGASRVEEVLVVVLNKVNKPLKVVRLTSGSQDSCLLPVRDVLAAVLRHGGAGFAVAHNHPSGNPAPSVEDLSVTRELLSGAKAVGLTFIDHVVVGSGRWVSVSEARLLGEW